MKTISMIVALCLILFVTHIDAKPFYKLNHDKSGSLFSLSQLDAADQFGIKKTVNVGSARTAYTTFSPSGKYLAISLITKGKKDDEVVIYNASDLTEISTIKIKKLALNNITIYRFEPHVYFTDDEKSVLLISKKGKVLTLNSYDTYSAQTNYKVALSRKIKILDVISENNRIITGSLLTLTRYKELQVYDMLTGKLIVNLTDNKFSSRYAIDGDHLLIDFKQRSSQAVSPYELRIVDLITGTTLTEKTLGKKAPAYANKINPEDAFYFVSHVSGGTDGLKLFRVEGGKLLELASIDAGRIKPKKLFYDKTQQHFYVLGKNNSTFFDLSVDQQFGYINNPFDIATGFFSIDGQRVYLREGKGSEVGVFDFTSRKMIKESNTGRKSVKFGKFFAQALVATAGAYYTGYFSVTIYKYDTAMLVDGNDKNLYAINPKTNDVTIFDAKTLEGKKAVATGAGTFVVFRLDNELYPDTNEVYVASADKINYFNAADKEAFKTIEYDNLRYIDLDENVFFCSDKDDNLLTYRLSTGNLINSLGDEKTLSRVFSNSSFY
jgi:hypothetical protein